MEITIATALAAFAVLTGVLLIAWAVLSRVQANASRIVELHQLLEQARERAPAARLQETERYLATIREEFNSLLESQDAFREQVLRNVNRLSTTINRRLGGSQQGRRTDLEEDPNADLPDKITKEQAEELERRARERAGGGSAAQQAESALSRREEIRRRIRDQYYAARRAPMSGEPKEESA